MNRIDQEDFVRDGRSDQRRQNFRAGEIAARRWEQQHPVSLAAHLAFLASIQKVLGEFPVDHAPWVGTDFRL